MAVPPDVPPLREVIARHGINARRALGQHFLMDANLTTRIARAAQLMAGDTAIEVGAGPGGLTRALLASPADRVVAIERDPRCVAALRDLAAIDPKRLRVVEADALDADLVTLGPSPRRIVANLPYNVATPLLIGWLRRAGDFASMTLMFQKEVADRLAATTGGRDYGRLTVITQWLCDVRREFNVDRRAFVPPPKVMSSVVTLTPRPVPLAPADWTSLERVTQAAFGQRRKMLRTSLRPLGLDLDALAIDPSCRAEDLSVEAFCAIARASAAQPGSADSGTREHEQ